MTAEVFTKTSGGIGQSPTRPDGTLKVTGEFAFSSDLWADKMLWGATLRSPHPRARIRGIDLTAAVALPGVSAVLTAEDVPGTRFYGLEHADQPVLASSEVRYQGEPVAIVAADHPETARRAAALIAVDYAVLRPVVDADVALAPDADAVHPSGNQLRHVPIRKGDTEATAAVVVSGVYEVGMQDQAFLGPESGLALPAEDGTPTTSRSRPASGCRSRRCVSPSAASAVPLVDARTCRCRCMRACWLCAPGAR
jgi:CO/xanthine dehydrogenase Mo-binding subunit